MSVPTPSTDGAPEPGEVRIEPTFHKRTPDRWTIEVIGLAGIRMFSVEARGPDDEVAIAWANEMADLVFRPVVPEDRPAQCPTWIDQTKFGPGEGDEAGNCMQAAVASLLGMPLDEVPHFAAVGVKGDVESWWDPFVAWCREHGYHPAIHEAPVDGALGLMSGPSPRGVGWHCVVSRGPDVAHDPHPSRDGLALGDREWWYLIPLKPAGVPALDDDTRREVERIVEHLRHDVDVIDQGAYEDMAQVSRSIDRAAELLAAAYLGGTDGR